MYIVDLTARCVFLSVYICCRSSSREKWHKEVERAVDAKTRDDYAWRNLTWHMEQYMLVNTTQLSDGNLQHNSWRLMCASIMFGTSLGKISPSGFLQEFVQVLFRRESLHLFQYLHNLVLRWHCLHADGWATLRLVLHPPKHDLSGVQRIWHVLDEDIIILRIDLNPSLPLSTDCWWMFQRTLLRCVSLLVKAQITASRSLISK